MPRQRSEPIPNGEVHPTAALFPLMTADELDDLAADIKANGLLNPVVLDSEGMLIDGRNRLAACKIAGVEPRYASLNGHDPVAFILASNVLRRHMTQGQRAMVVAKGEQIAPSMSNHEAARIAGVDRRRILQAQTILEYAKEQVDSVISGATAFDVAYRLAQQRQEDSLELERKAEKDRADLGLLQDKAQDLAELVVEDRMPLEEAMAAYNVRYRERIEEEQKATEARQRMTASFAQALTMLDGVMLTEPTRIARNWEMSAMGAWSDERWRPLWSADGIRGVARRLEALAQTIDEEGAGILG